MKIKINESEEIGMNSPITRQQALKDFEILLDSYETLVRDTAAAEDGEHISSFDDFRFDIESEYDAEYNPMVIVWRYYNYLIKTIK